MTSKHIAYLQKLHVPVTRN